MVPATLLLFLAACAEAVSYPTPPPSLRLALQPPSLNTSSSAGPPPIYAFDIRSFGAIGNGITDNTLALQYALDAAVEAHGGTVFIPTGIFRITGTVTVKASVSLSIRGEGWQSALLWENDSDLLVFSPSDGTQLSHSFFSDFAILCGGSLPKTPTSTALKFSTGIVQSTLSALLFYGGGPLPNASLGNAVMCGTNLDLGGTSITDTVTVRDTLHWVLGGTGVVIGRGSEVRVLGGRIIGAGVRNDTSIGVHVTGNNGGVHVSDTDVIGLGTGILLDNASGAGSNRETFITHATMDSDGVGLLVNDSSYVSVAGIWAASSDHANVLLGEGAGGCHVVIAGGTIFNGGSLVPPGTCAAGDGTRGCNGMVVLAGDFSLSGVMVWANKGVGLLVPPTPKAVEGFVVSGCRFEGNGQGASISNASADFAVVGNVFRNNNLPSALGTGGVVQGNVNTDR